MRTISDLLTALHDINAFTATFPNSGEHPAQFEYLISEVFACIFHLPHHDNTTTNDPRNLIKWNGRINPIDKAPQGQPDIIAKCYGFTLIIEPTLKINAEQWSREYAPSIRHCSDYCATEHCPRTSVIGILVCKTIHDDTYISLRNHPEHEIKIIPLAINHLEKILSITSLAYSCTHLEIRRLLNEISEALRTSQSLPDYEHKISQVIANFQERFLKNEKIIFIGVKIYEIIKRTPGIIISTDILTALSSDPEVNQYFNQMKDILTIKDIVESVTRLGLAYSQARLILDEEPHVFEKIPAEDIKARLEILKSKIT